MEITQSWKCGCGIVEELNRRISKHIKNSRSHYTPATRTKSIVCRNSSNFIVISPGRLKHQNKTQAHNKRHLLNTQRKPLHLANVNVRSVRNKTTVIVYYVITNDVDICVLTETWLIARYSVSIEALSPPGYIFKNFPRKSERKPVAQA